MSCCICDTFNDRDCFCKHMNNEYTNYSMCGCKIITSVEKYDDFEYLSGVSPNDCTCLITLKHNEAFRKLTRFSISGRNDLTSMSGVRQLLIRLHLECYTPVKFLKILNPQSMTHLSLYEVDVNLTSLVEIGCMVSLTSLVLSSCRELISLKGIENLIKLTSLCITHCGSLLCVKEIRYLTQLTTLTFSCCTALTTVDGIEYLEHLTWLDLSSCAGLRCIPVNTICLEHLTDIYIRFCASLPPLPTFHNCVMYGSNAKEEVFKVLSDEIRNNTDTWTRHDHEKFGANVNKLFVTILLGLQQIFPNFEIDPELIEETLQQCQQCHRCDLDY